MNTDRGGSNKIILNEYETHQNLTKSVNTIVVPDNKKLNLTKQ